MSWYLMKAVLKSIKAKGHGRKPTSLFSKGVEIIVTTLGSKGCIVRTPHWIQEYPSQG